MEQPTDTAADPASGTAAVPRRHRPRAFSWPAALVVFAILLWWGVSRSFPYLPRPLELTVVFPEGIAGRIEPIVSTGIFEQADFLSVSYLDETTALVKYDAWGPGGPESQPFSFEPGKPYALTIDMPALDFGGSRPPAEKRPLRVTFDGREILNEPVFFYPRRPEHVYFGVSPIGGNYLGALFRGQLFHPDGHGLQGGPAAYFSLRERFVTFVTAHPLQIGLIMLAAIVAGFACAPVWRWLAQRVAAAKSQPLVGHRAAPHRAFVATAAGCVLLFAALITGGTFRFIFEESFGSFYDHQAASLLRGRLDVPPDAIGGEAFVVAGKHYGYFGVTPAILRLPLVAMGVGFGQLSRLFMLAYYAASLVAGYLLLCHAARLAGGRNRWPSAAATVLLTLSLGLGSSLFFLGARAYLYHEAILCGAMFALGTVYCTFRYLEAPASRWCWGALAGGLAAVHARPSSGLFALCLLGAASLVHVQAAWRSRRLPAAPRHLGVGALAALAILSFSGMSYLKFGTFDGSPFRYSIQYTPERRAKFEERNFHLGNVRRNFDTYVLQPDFQLQAGFPYIALRGGERRAYPAARIDLAEPTLAFPYAMPALFALAVVGGAWAFVRSPALRPPITVLLLGLTPMALALFSAIVTSHRFTADFCPFFAAAAACGMAVLDAEKRSTRRTALALTGGLAAAAMAVTFALSLHFQGEYVWGVPDEVRENYRQLRDAVNGFFGRS